MACVDCALLADCIEAGQASRLQTTCAFSPPRFLGKATPASSPRRDALRQLDQLWRGSYVSPLDPPPGDPRAAHGAACPRDCPCRRRGLRVIDGGAR